MRDTLRQLIEIERIDSEIDRLDGELKKFPAERRMITGEIEQAEQVVAAARAMLESEELEERRLESKMRDQEELILRLNHQTAQVSSNQAYTALQHELDAAEAAKTEFETLALEHMEAIDRAKEAIGAAQEKLRSLEALAPEKNRELDAREQGLEAERAENVSAREKVSVGVDAGILKRYEAIRRKRQPAIALLDGNSCSRCRIVLPRIRLSEIVRLEQVHECSSCKRLLAPATVLDEGD